MDKKQKTLLVITIAAFGYLGYQVYGLVSQDVSSQPAAQATASYQPKLARTTDGPVQTAQAAPKDASIQDVIPQAEDSMPKDTASPSQPLVKSQKAYLDMVNQYELAKMKRRLLEERAAIAAAQHRIATLNEQTRSIDNNMLQQSAAEDNNALDSHSKTPYQLSYLDNQGGQWTATLNQSGHYHEVRIGTELPDGMKIIKIDRQGVTIEDGGQSELVTFNGVIPVKAEAPIKIEAPKVDEKPKPATPIAKAKAMPTALETSEKNETVVSSDTIEKAAQKALLHAGLLPKKGVEKVSETGNQMHPGVVVSVKVPEKKERDIVVAETKPAEKLAKKLEDKTTIKRAAVSIKNLGPANAKALLAQANPPLSSAKPAPMPTTSAPLNTKARYTQDEHRLLRLSPQSYTIQLIGSYHRDIVENFAIANDLGNQAMQFHVKNRGRPWYMLLYGNYKTWVEAQNALRQLPPNLAPENPWIRSVAEVQHDVRSRSHARKKKS